MKKWIMYIVLIALGSFLWWAFSPLLFDKEVQDDLDPSLEARLEMQRQADERKASGQTDSKSSEQVGGDIEIEKDQGVQSQGPYAITGTDGHPASGQMEIIRSPEENLIRYLNYDGTNGPDLKIYLSKDLEATDYIDLGPSKGNKGNIIYGVPMDADLSEYKYVLTWCEAFSVLFDYAEIK